MISRSIAPHFSESLIRGVKIYSIDRFESIINEPKNEFMLITVCYVDFEHFDSSDVRNNSKKWYQPFFPFNVAGFT